MPRGLRVVLVSVSVAAAVACFVGAVALRVGSPPDPDRPEAGLAAAARAYSPLLGAVFLTLAIVLAYTRELVPPSEEEDDTPRRADDAVYRRYRVRGGLALVAGAALILVSGLDLLLHPTDDSNRPSSLMAGIGLALLAVGSVYRYDLPNIYRRVAELEDRLGRRIDALGNGHAGNGAGRQVHDDEDQDEDNGDEDDEDPDEDDSDDDGSAGGEPHHRWN
jgi:hypothetical protein